MNEQSLRAKHDPQAGMLGQAHMEARARNVTGTELTPQPPIKAALADLSDQIGKLADLVDALHVRVTPVLGPDTDIACDVPRINTARDETSEVSSSITSLNEAVFRLQGRVYNILGRLEI